MKKYAAAPPIMLLLTAALLSGASALLWTAPPSVGFPRGPTARLACRSPIPVSLLLAPQREELRPAPSRRRVLADSLGEDPLRPDPSRRRVLTDSLRRIASVAAAYVPAVARAATLEMDVNNMLGREYTAFPGLYPTIATKLVFGAKNHPYKSKREVYDALEGNEAMIERLKSYDKAIVIRKYDSSVRQFKESQICKYECKKKVSATN